MELVKQLASYRFHESDYSTNIDVLDYIEQQSVNTNYGNNSNNSGSDDNDNDGDEEAILASDQKLLASIGVDIARMNEDKDNTWRKGRRSRQIRVESDEYGRNPLHYAASWGCTRVLRAIRRISQRSYELNTTKMNSKKDRAYLAGQVASLFLAGINHRDEESGWTALHRAIYYGNIRSAIELLQMNEVDLSVKDNDDMEPMDMLREYIPLSTNINGQRSSSYRRLRYSSEKEEEVDENDGADDVDDVDDDIAIDYYRSINGHDKRQLEVYPRTTLYTWGNNANYILGHADQGDRIKPDRVFLPSSLMNNTDCPITSFEKQQHIHQNLQHVVMMAMSKLHMLVVTAPINSYNLLTCGFGHGGRLGNSESTRFTLEPVRGLPNPVQSAACGRDHTVVITIKGEVYTFGGNRWGQLGYVIVQEESSRVGAIYEHDKENPVQLEPKRVLNVLRNQSMTGCSASTWHTVVYTSNALYTFGRDMGQLGYETTNEVQSQPRRVSQLPQNQTIIQAVATEMATTCLMAHGEVYALTQGRCQRVTLPIHRIPQNMRTYQPKSVLESGVAKLTSDTECYVGALTTWGDIFTWSTDPSQSPATRRAKAIKRLWSARCLSAQPVDFSIGHNARVILCTRAGQVWITKENGKAERISQLHRATSVCAGISGSYAAIRTELPLEPVTSARPTLANDLLQALVPRQTVGDNNTCSSKDVTAMLQRGLVAPACTTWDSDGLGDIRISLADYTIMAHRFILARRSSVLGQLLSSTKGESTLRRDNVTIRYSVPSQSIIIDGCSIEALIYILIFIYGKRDNISSMIEEDVVRLSHLLDLPELRRLGYQNSGNLLVKQLTLPFSVVPVTTTSATDTSDNLWTLGDYADVVLLLSDKRIMAHRAILCHRSDFFATLLGSNSSWLTGRELPLQVDLKHRSWSFMQYALKYMYTDQEVGLISKIDFESTDAYFTFMEELLSLADELLLEQLKQLCQQLLGKHVAMHTVLSLANIAQTYHGRSLMAVCLDFLCNNIDAALESRLLYQADPTLLYRLETEWNQRQLAVWPVTRSHAADLAFHPNDWHRPERTRRSSVPASTELNTTKKATTATPLVTSSLSLNIKKANKQNKDIHGTSIAATINDTELSKPKLTWANQSNTQHVTASASPERISLRDIMQEQEKKIKPSKQQALPPKTTSISSHHKEQAVVSPAIAATASTTIPITTKPKLSQKERKRQQQHKNYVSTTSPPPPPTAAAAVVRGLPVSSSPNKPRRSSTVQNTSTTTTTTTTMTTSSPAPVATAIPIKLRRDSGNTRSNVQSSSVKSSAVKSPRGWSMPLVGTTPMLSSVAPSSNDFPSIGDTAISKTSSPSRRQSRRSLTQVGATPSSTESSSFMRIQREQEEEQRRLDELRTAKRSLVDIQTEELVIQAWREYYADLGIENWEPPADFRV
ncbi:hypothetical protein BDF22DRAFT_679915 [Syncephalis plumigaleata]|nr:hypothetical protein BDF22DRAFT_679915 [Syncephalis plumigaleata]